MHTDNTKSTAFLLAHENVRKFGVDQRVGYLEIGQIIKESSNTTITIAYIPYTQNIWR